MNEIAKNSTALTPIDGYNSLDGEPSANGAEYAKFDAACPQKLWHGRDGAAMYPGPYIGVDCLIELLRWNDKREIDRIIQKPGEPLPDVDTLNNAIDPKDWERLQRQPKRNVAKEPHKLFWSIQKLDQK